MASTLRNRLDELASSFANDVLHAIGSASIDDLLSESAGGGRRGAARREPPARSVGRGGAPGLSAAPAGRRRGGRLARRSAGDIAGVVDRIVDLLRASPKGLRAEQIRQKLGFQSKELPRPLKEAVDAGRLGKSGQKRATTYFVKSASAPRVASAPAAGRARAARKGPAKKKRAKKRAPGARGARSARSARSARKTGARKK
ncbi:MAG TPA: hypothetical protein VGL81_16090 [Polyangiaceae bacterium]|jgi:hypothetical protein